MKPVVAVEPMPTGTAMCLWTADGDMFTVPFKPWLVSGVRDCRISSDMTRLQGVNPMRWLYRFRDIDHWTDGSRRSPYGQSLIWRDLRVQFLALHPEYRLFQGLPFSALRRMTIDIETTGLKPERDRVLMAVVGTDTDVSVISHDDERKIFADLEERIAEYDPDVIEGYNIFGFDIPFLAARAGACGMPGLAWGRNGERVTKGRLVRFRVGSREQPVQTYDVYGRHVIDGLLAVMRYDSNTGGRLDSFSLKRVAEAMGVACPDRVIVQHEAIADTFRRDPDMVAQYAVQDVQEARAVIDRLVQPEYHMAAVIPDTLHNIMLSGVATKINQCLVGQYIHAGYAIPYPSPPSDGFEGAFIEMRRAGCFSNVYKVDATSLYPNIMLHAVGVDNDELGAFHSTLQAFTDKRIALKASNPGSPEERAYKILINGFYGYLATGGMNFADRGAASSVARIGRSIVNGIVNGLVENGRDVIEIDTDGVFFVQRPEHKPLTPRQIIRKGWLPPWIQLDIEGPFQAMLSIKPKNYVLVKSGKMIYHGAALRSRRDEAFGREFIDRACRAIIDGHPERVAEIYEEYRRRIIDGEIDLDELARTERISDKTLARPQRLARVIESDGLDEGDTVKVYRDESEMLQSVAASERLAPDRLYYLERLYKFAQRLKPVLPDWKISPPSKAMWGHRIAQEAGQLTLAEVG